MADRGFVADWAPLAAGHPGWFADHVHMNGAGGMAFAQFLRPIMLTACGAPCSLASLDAEATMLRPDVGERFALLRWRGNEVAASYDLETKRSPRTGWRTIVQSSVSTSYRVRGTPRSSLQARVRARDTNGDLGAWSPPETIRFKH